ncbi:MAG: glycosyltransferase [Verrucomicrobiae bacterium]|nr:glycosyltransferase [Verrucomicrobiae bacterium]
MLLPVRNEEMNLRVMLRILQTVLEFPHEVLVIHDTPDDRSIPVVRELQPRYPGLRLIHNTLGRGVINAVRAGVAAARAETVVILCADDTGPVLVIEDMLALMREGCDFVSVTRYAHGGRRLGGSLIGGLLSRTANWLFHRLVRSPFTDATTGGKMFRRALFEKFDLQSRPVGWAFAFEMAIKAQHLGLKLGEVPLVSIDRLFGGQSSFRVGPWVKEYLRWFLWGVRAAWKAPRRPEPARVRVPVFYQPTADAHR